MDVPCDHVCICFRVNFTTTRYLVESIDVQDPYVEIHSSSVSCCLLCVLLLTYTCSTRTRTRYALAYLFPLVFTRKFHKSVQECQCYNDVTGEVSISFCDTHITAKKTTDWSVFLLHKKKKKKKHTYTPIVCIHTCTRLDSDGCTNIWRVWMHAIYTLFIVKMLLPCFTQKSGN